MNKLETLSNVFNHKGQEIRTSSKANFQYYFDALHQELVESNYLDDYYSNFKLSDKDTYLKIKKLPKTEKIDFIFCLIEERVNLQKLLNGRETYHSANPVRTKNMVAEKTLSALFRQNIGFSDEEYMTLFSTFHSNKNVLRFNYWPIAQLVRQLESQAKKNPLSESLISYLTGILKWEVMSLAQGYWGTDMEKIVIKLKALVAVNGEPNKIPPFELQEDQFGNTVNAAVKEMTETEQDFWFELFHHCVKATTGKPSAKFLKATQGIVSEFGNAKFKKQMQIWLEFVIKMEVEATETTHTYSNGEQYTYWNNVFLQDKNVKLLKGLVWTMSKFHDKTTLAILSRLTVRCFKKIPGVGPTSGALGNACIYTLGHSKGLDGISHLSRLKSNVQQMNTKDLIQKYIDEQAIKLGITAAEVEELSIPTYGLTDGKRTFQFEDYQFNIEITGVGKVQSSWVKPDGKVQKSLPAFVKNSAILKQKLKSAKADIKEIKKYVTAQRNRIDNMYLQKRVWTLEQFLPLYIEHGLVGFVAQRLVWQFENDTKKATGIFINNQWQNQKGEPIDWLKKDTKVSLWHPIYSETAEILAWRNRLEALEVKQPMKQAYREIYLLTEAEENTKSYSNRMAAHILKQHQFNALAKLRDWSFSLIGAWDAPQDDIASKYLPAYNMTAQYWIGTLNDDNDSFNDTGIWYYVSTDQVKFVNNHETINMEAVPPIVFSEIMRDVDMFVGVASVGNDPQWADNGGMPQYRDYWQSYSFGDLSEVAKTRKAVLENLLPRLKLRDVARIDGKFLVVKGKIRTYKIHIGSTNILMTPNDQYLCIVPSRGKEKTGDVFLPFEGDNGLSIVLSKAFLLAADDKITDSTITSQIKR